MASKSKLFRGRASYKTSDVAALFIIGLVLGAVMYLLLTLISMAYDRVFGGG